MKVQTVLIALAVAASEALANPAISSRSDFALKDSHPVPPTWTKIGPAAKDGKIRLEIGLTQSQFDELERHLYEVSDPDHHRYGQHLTQAEVNELVKPHADASDLVHEWLREHGIEKEHLSYSSAGDWISVALPVSVVETMLNTEYSLFEHEDGTQLVRAPEWSLPKHLHQHIDVIAPTNSFFRGQPQAKIIQKRSSDLMPVTDFDGSIKEVDLSEHVLSPDSGDFSIKKSCNFSAITPRCLRTLYGTRGYQTQAAGKNKIGLNNFLMETNNISDVNLFLSVFRPGAEGFANKIKFHIIDHGNNQQTPNTPKQNRAQKDVEGNLDAEYIISLTYPTPVYAYNTGGMPPYKPDKNTPTDTNEPYLTWTTYFLNQKDAQLPSIISTSYGDDEQTVPFSYATRVCKQYAQIGARGVSLLFSAGDSGVGGSKAHCVSNTKPAKAQFLPAFSVGCPYVTAVGGTKHYPEVVAYDPINGYVPGGGFSNYFARPKYQDAVVKEYLKTIPTSYKGLYNRSGRAYPDIAAQSQSFIITYNGRFVLVDGTSAASPTAASVLALVNDALIASGKSPLGFLNPWLYKKGHKAFTDVTSGSVKGCGTAGFAARVGWDAASGFGTPNFKNITRLLGV